MKKLVATILTATCMLSLISGTAIATNQHSTENQIKETAEVYLSAAAKNMWLYESNDLALGTIGELAAQPRLMDKTFETINLQAEEINAYMEDITFLQEKADYFKHMRQESNLQRNDFKLEYAFAAPEVAGNRATVLAVEHISFHYPDFPDVLSELTNYYTVDLIKYNGDWLVAGLTAENDDFDKTFKGTGFTAENAEAFLADLDKRASENDVMNSLMAEYDFAEAEVDGMDTDTMAASNDSWYSYNPSNASAYAYTYVSEMFGTTDWDDVSSADKAIGRTFYNANFKSWGEEGVDCQNFASQCIWAGFNGSNSPTQIANSPVMDKGGSYKWYGAVPGGSATTSWTSCSNFRNYITNEYASGDPDMKVKKGSTTGDFSSVYSELEGALLHVNGGGHAVIVTNETGPSRSQILYCCHTSDRKGIALSEFYGSGNIYYFIPQQMKVRNAPEVKIIASLRRPVPKGTLVSLGGMTNTSCSSIIMTITAPSGANITTSSSRPTSINRNTVLDEKGLYVVTISATAQGSTTPVTYTYTVRTY